MMDILLNDGQKRIISPALGDLNMTPEEFAAVMRGKTTRNWPDRGFCVARLLESVNWFDIVKIFPPPEICEAWDEAKKYSRNDTIRKGLELPPDLYDRTLYPMQDKAIALFMETPFYLTGGTALSR